MIMVKDNLANKKCEACEGKGKPFTKTEAESYLSNVPGWVLREDATGIYREFVMKNFQAALKLMNQIGDIAETENHHPDIHLTGYRKLRIELATHAIGGLSENDFILAAKINQLPAELKHS